MTKKPGNKESEENQWTGAKPALTLDDEYPAEETSGGPATLSPRDTQEAMTAGRRKAAGSRRMPGEQGEAPAISRPGWEGVVIGKPERTGRMPGEGSPMKSAVTEAMPGEGPSLGAAMAKPTLKKRPRAHVLVPLDAEEAAVEALAAPAVGDSPGGTTAHFNIFYDPALGADGPTYANAVLAVCEADYESLRGYFGGITPPGLPFQIHLTTGSNGAGHATCAATNISIGADSGPGLDIPFVRSLVIAEEDEVFEAAYGHGWDCGASNGEGLSRVLANAMYPGAEPANFVSAPVWLDGARPDFVTVTDPTDRNYTSIGCSVLFLNWLRYQLHFSWAEIIAAGAATLAQTYTNLTGRADALSRFKALLQAHFPQGSPSGLTTDNPYPLLSPSSHWSGWDSRGGLLTSPPSVVSWGPDRLDIFAKGGDNAIWHQAWNGSSWSGWDSRGGLVTSPPTVCSWGPNRIDIFALGGDNAVWHQAWNGSSWSGWESRGGLLTSPPSGVCWGPNRIDIFALGGDNAVWHQAWNGSSWSGWDSRGGLLTSPPTVCSWGPNRLDIFALGGDNAVWHQAWNGSSWSGWESRGGLLTSPPVAVCWDENRIDLFAKGGDNAIWHQAWNGSSWSGWDSRGGLLTSPPTVCSWGPNRLDIFALGGDNAVWHQAWNGSSWSGWESRGGLLTSPPCAVSWSADRIDLFAKGGDNAIWHQAWG
jgi:hypothetical protein